MAIDVGAVTLKLKQAEVDYGKYNAAAKDLDGKMKRKMGEFQLVNQGLWQGKDHIKELEKELAEAKVTFNKMASNKITPIKKSLSDIGQTAANVAAMTSKLEKEMDVLKKALDTATGDVAKKKAAYDQIKKLATLLNRVFTELNGMKQEIAGLPNTPTL